MKKLIAAMLCLMLLCTAAFAEESARIYTIENPMTATSVTGLFTYEVPQTYHVFTDAYAQEFLANTTAGDIATKAGVDENTAQTLLDTIAGTDFTTADYVYSDDFSARAVIVANPDSGWTKEYLQENVQSLDEMMFSYAAQIGLSEESCMSIGIATAGNNPQIWYGFAMNMFGTIGHQFLTCDDSGTLYNLFISGMPQDAEMALLESFTVIQ